MASTTGLVKNTDFSAELLLNKVMNKQYRSQSGKTLTLGGRINASKLNAESDLLNSTASNLAKTVAYANASENTLTEALKLANNLLDANNQTDSDTRKSLAGTLKTALTALINTKSSDTAVTSSMTADLNGDGSNKITLGLNGSSIFSDLNNLITAMDSNGTTVNASSIKDVITKLTSAIADQGLKAQVVQNRYNMLNDLSSAYEDASVDMAVNGGGSSTSLLNALL